MNIGMENRNLDAMRKETIVKQILTFWVDEITV